MYNNNLVSQLMALLLLLTAGAVAGAAGAPAIDFNSGWRFALTDAPGTEAPSLDDSGWRALDLPHDWSIEGAFSPDNTSGTGGGFLPGGVGWYRKHFNPGPIAAGRHLFLDFDGAYMNASVYVNGHLLGTRPYGYAPFSYEITPYLKADSDNVIAVRVDNAETPNTRWYSGCGIYRNVWLREQGDVRIPLWGQHVEPYDITPSSARVRVATTLENVGLRPVSATLALSLLDPDGRRVAAAERTVELAAGDSTVYTDSLALSEPRLWSTESPALYRLVTDVRVGGRTVDTYSVTTGLRKLRFDARRGFFLNDRPMKINGVCLHHDAGALGAVVNRRAIERQLAMMRDMGANAIRVSHNPPAPELLDLCDSMGLMVMDESFDMWRKRKTAHDYSRYFNEWHERDLRDMLLRDRNHPSIIMWSIGNEVLEQWSHADADTLSMDEANLLLNFGHSADQLAHEDSAMSVNSLLTVKLADMVRDYDRSRPITAGCNEPDPGNHLFRSGALDVIGFNYHDGDFLTVPEKFPGKPFLVTESVSALQTRGYYRMPSDSMYIWPERWDKPFEADTMACSAYDNCHVPWGSTHERTMQMVEDNPFIMGQFVWTGFDYIGEPTPFGWPARSSFFGIVDLAGIPKDVYYMYQSRWRPDMDVLHLFPHWSWTPGQQVDMWAYYNNADEVELYVNGRSQGVRRPEPGKYHASWRVTFEPGEVTAVSRRDGREVLRRTIRTAGAPAAVRLTPDRRGIDADGRDLCYVLAEVVDAEGNLCPDATDLITFAVGGAGRNVGVDNGSQTSTEPFKSDRRHAFHGKAMLIVQSDGRPGDITVTATAPDLKSDTVNILTK